MRRCWLVSHKAFGGQSMGRTGEDERGKHSPMSWGGWSKSLSIPSLQKASEFPFSLEKIWIPCASSMCCWCVSRLWDDQSHKGLLCLSQPRLLGTMASLGWRTITLSCGWALCHLLLFLLNVGWRGVFLHLENPSFIKPLCDDKELEQKAA